MREANTEAATLARVYALILRWPDPAEKTTTVPTEFGDLGETVEEANDDLRRIASPGLYRDRNIKTVKVVDHSNDAERVK